MPVYVDSYERKWKRGGRWSHLFADSEVELLDFAISIGCSMEWLQRRPRSGWPHFDVPGFRRNLAIKAGAIVVNSRFAVTKRREWERRNGKAN